jgi:dephospho-CoA kinase
MGSGKSAVCQMLMERSYPVYIADDRAKALMHDNLKVVSAIIAEFGPEVYVAGELQREKLAQIIFNDEECRLALEAIVHPAVRADFEQWQENQSSALIFKESALVFEKGDPSCSEIACVIAPEHVRVERIKSRNPQWSEGEIRARMATQWSDEQREARADYLIANTNSLSDLEQEVDYFLSKVI